MTNWIILMIAFAHLFHGEISRYTAPGRSQRISRRYFFFMSGKAETSNSSQRHSFFALADRMRSMTCVIYACDCMYKIHIIIQYDCPSTAD